MKTIVTNQIIVSAPTAELMKWCRENRHFQILSIIKKKTWGFTPEMFLKQYSFIK